MYLQKSFTTSQWNANQLNIIFIVKTKRKKEQQVKNEKKFSLQFDLPLPEDLMCFIDHENDGKSATLKNTYLKIINENSPTCACNYFEWKQEEFNRKWKNCQVKKMARRENQI